ncbi:P-type conjugative transfer protein TrbJ [Rhodomicrobium vannielii ATCC 17100]|uniref:P-type conjugative transfer protein TrbJ n=1 Tax=Rhodomicrobium vannielii (strain ATCC 17100 / DSM 162 / LMG 4299 / NCIMB 10020 / ATH 3.1.1) TaxID=648757 RepID=E3HZH3_RHOVT|nr:P-type conjugative transfer protein TrbJ [Rhodomicrobium vannielii]ADP71008.1 P-type conjugative transfer protein TrbJ [Rhodomicrobium vannielii ATCC 17100]
MKRQLKVAALALVAIACVSVVSVRQSRAQAVYCTNCASEITQLLNLARLVDQLGTQGNILQTNTNQFQTMTVNTTPLPSLEWGNGAANIQSVNTALASANSLSFAKSGLTAQFSQHYGTYDSYLTSPATSAAFADKYQQWSTNANASVLSTLEAGSLQSGQIGGDELALINRLKIQTGAVQGNLEALQTLAQVGLLNIEQLQKLRQLILADTSLKANAIQTEADQSASQQAAWRRFIKAPETIPTTGGARF